MSEVLGLKPERNGGLEFIESLHVIENMFLELQGTDFSNIQAARDKIAPLLRAIHDHNTKFFSDFRSFAEVIINEVEIRYKGKPFLLQLTRFGSQNNFTDRLNLATRSISGDGPELEILREIMA